MIKRFQRLHHLLPYLQGFHFALARGAQAMLDLIDFRLDALDRNRPLLQGAQQTGAQLFFVEGLSAAVLFDNPGQH